MPTPTPFNDTLIRAATISPCGLYRYELWRIWSMLPAVMFIMLNPSTADGSKDDATIRKCMAYARRWGYGSLCVANLFAYRATDPRDMKAAEDPVGPDNDETLRSLAAGAGLIVAAWGAHGSYQGRDAVVLAMLPKVWCLHQTKSGAPGHPLYLPGDATPKPLLPAPGGGSPQPGL